MSLALSSPAYQSVEAVARGAGGSDTIPTRFATTAAGGENRSIPLTWTGTPGGTKSFALELVDHAPMAHEWMHWAVVGISAQATGIPEAASGTSAMPDGAVELVNSYGRRGYGGPQPPAATGAHPYSAILYALDVAKPSVPDAPSHEGFVAAISGHVLATATYTGRFGR